MATSFNDLPQELCNRIVQFFRYDGKTLLRLCLTSVRFVNEAQSYLYATLICRTFEHTTFFKSLKLLSTFTIHKPSLARYVKTFVYDIPLKEEDLAIYEGLRHAVRLMINVTSLEIHTKIPHSPQGFFHGCTFQLKHFRCRFASSDRTAIYKMLSTQPSLRSLYIDEFDRDFPSNCCLNIKRLLVEDWRSVVHILPGRSVSVLELLQVEPFFDSVPPSIMTQLGNLSHLTFQTNTPYDFLKSVAPYLTRLMILRIIGKDNETPSGMSITEKPEVLCKLTNLKIFVWSLENYCRYDSRMGVANEQYEMLWDLVGLWFQGMPKLEVVYTLDNDSWDTEVYYTRWTKDMSLRSVEAKVALGRKSLYTK